MPCSDAGKCGLIIDINIKIQHRVMTYYTLISTHSYLMDHKQRKGNGSLWQLCFTVCQTQASYGNFFDIDTPHTLCGSFRFFIIFLERAVIISKALCPDQLIYLDPIQFSWFNTCICQGNRAANCFFLLMRLPFVVNWKSLISKGVSRLALIL